MPARSRVAGGALPQGPDLEANLYNPHQLELLDDTIVALLPRLLEWLRNAGYSFVTPTPATHARVLARNEGAGGLADAFGWNRPFEGSSVDPALLAQLVDCGLVRTERGRFRSNVRVSTVGRDLFVHSGYPTQSKDAVFLGPDSYRFADLIVRELERCPQPPQARIVDIGTGAGVGALAAARCCPLASLIMTDVNPLALAFARVNAAAAGIHADYVQSSTLAPVAGELDVVLANPPYIMDAEGRDYRDGGDMHGAAVALAMAEEATARLAPAGRLILYTGSAIIAGTDPLRRRLVDLAEMRGCDLDYREIDPDVFGEELTTPAYADVDRIALVAAVMDRR